MIERIVLIEDIIMCFSFLVASASFVMMIDRYNKYRYKLDEMDDDKAGKIYFKAFIISALMGVVSWLSIFITGIIDIATK